MTEPTYPHVWPSDTRLPLPVSGEEVPVDPRLEESEEQGEGNANVTITVAGETRSVLSPEQAEVVRLAMEAFSREAAHLLLEAQGQTLPDLLTVRKVLNELRTGAALADELARLRDLLRRLEGAVSRLEGRGRGRGEDPATASAQPPFQPLSDDLYVKPPPCIKAWAEALKQDLE